MDRIYSEKMNTLALLIIFSTIKTLLQHSAYTQAEEAQVSTLQHLHGFIFEDKLLFDQVSLSPVHCAYACLTRPQCVMFTVTCLACGQPNQCRGHSAVMKKGNDASQQVLGAHVFVLKERAEALMWLNRSCRTNSKCPATSSECFTSRCLCTPGFYYSISQDACVRGCDKTNLQPDFLAYPGSLLFSEEIEYRQNISQQRCMELCRADRRCRTFDLDYGDCTTHYSTARDNPSDFYTALGPSTWHFQRMCD